MLIWLILFIPFLCVNIVFMYNASKKVEQNRSINNYIGSKFSIDNFLDLNGNSTKLDFSKSKITIVDFWQRDCPPCLREMKEFKSLLKSRENSVSIISVSINSYKIWRPLFSSEKPAFSFLGDSIVNWKHLVLKSNIDPRLNNIIPADNIQELLNKYQTNTFPAYFVMNNTGTIIATPASLVEYLKVEVLHQNKYLVFITNKGTWAGAYIWIPKLLVEYSGYFWILLMLVSVVRKRKTTV